MFVGHGLLTFALLLFLIAIVRLCSCRMLVTPIGIVACAYTLCCLFVVYPVLVFSSTRDYTLSSGCQWFVIVIALTCLGCAFFMRRPNVDIEPVVLHWRFASLRTYLFFFLMVCFADPLLSIALYGKVGIVHLSEKMNQATDQEKVATPLTFAAQAMGMLAAAILSTDFFCSRQAARQYFLQRGRWFDLCLVVASLGLNTLCGNRFMLIFSVLVFACGLALFNRLKIALASIGVLIMVVFFTIVGNYRFGRVEIRQVLDFESGVPFVDSALGWFSTYLEPIFPTLDVYLRFGPKPWWGSGWLSSIVPKPILDLLGVERTSPSGYMLPLVPHRGLTFRTMYADILVDFGIVPSLLIGAAIMLAGVYAYNTATRSPRHMLFFCISSHIIIWSPFLSAFYNLVYIAIFLGMLTLNGWSPAEEEEFE